MCPECEARRKMARDALINARIGEALGHVAKGAAEMIGLKPKVALVEKSDKAENPAKSKKNPGAAG